MIEYIRTVFQLILLLGVIQALDKIAAILQKILEKMP